MSLQFKKEYTKKLDLMLDKIFNIKKGFFYYITKYYKSIAYYSLDEQKSKFYNDLNVSLFYTTSSEKFNEGFYFNIEGTVKINKSDLVKFIEEINFYCWNRRLDPNIFDKAYFEFEIKRIYFCLKTNQIFLM